MVEHCLCKAGAKGSNPFISTHLFSRLARVNTQASLAWGKAIFAIFCQAYEVPAPRVFQKNRCDQKGKNPAPSSPPPTPFPIPTPLGTGKGVGDRGRRRCWKISFSVEIFSPCQRKGPTHVLIKEGVASLGKSLYVIFLFMFYFSKAQLPFP